MPYYDGIPVVNENARVGSGGGSGGYVAVPDGAGTTYMRNDAQSMRLQQKWANEDRAFMKGYQALIDSLNHRQRW